MSRDGRYAENAGAIFSLRNDLRTLKMGQKGKLDCSSYYLLVPKLQNRGVKDTLIACINGLKGFPDAITAVYPKAQIQLCIVHRVRNSRKFLPWEDYKAVTADLKQIYQSVTEEEALKSLDEFAQRWDKKYP